ncbi:MAG: hypothetical protein LAT50_12510 [Ectothiorhodospiraceae bacterium]|nr:hypothetical protein [Paracoccaceae bacterium]MCH8505132.1 hypothetical protein [Ectothiorhodospiraceae bacterium]
MKGMIGYVLSAVLLGASLGLQAADDEGEPPRWSLGAGAAVVAPEGGREGYAGYLNLGWRLAYSSPGAPRSYFGLELELSDTFESYRRDRGSDRIKGDVTTAGVYLAANTFMTERVFFRARLGGAYRYLDESHRAGRHQGRLAAGLGLGYSINRRLDLLTDASIQYLGRDARLHYVGSAGVRVHF